MLCCEVEVTVLYKGSAGRGREINELKYYIRCEIFRISNESDLGKKGEGFFESDFKSGLLK